MLMSECHEDEVYRPDEELIVEVEENLEMFAEEAEMMILEAEVLLPTT